MQGSVEGASDKLITSGGHHKISKATTVVPCAPLGGHLLRFKTTPLLEEKLLSACQLLRDLQAFAVLEPEQGEIRRMSDDSLLARLRVESGLYIMEEPSQSTAFFTFSEQSHLIEDCTQISPWRKLHLQYGHADLNSISKTTGKPISKAQKEDCKGCAQAKMVAKSMRPKVSFGNQVKTRPTNPLSIVTTDTSGPHRPSLEGFTYWSSFLSGTTRKVIPIFHRSKGEVQEKWIYTAKVEQKKLLQDMLVFKRDGAGELTGNNIAEYLTDQGIISRVTEPYNSVTNPQAERFVRTINTKARALMLEASLPEEFWKHSVEFACLAYNNTARHGQDQVWMSPEELYSGTRFDLEQLFVFGQFGHSLNQQPLSKFSAKGEPCVYLGIQRNSSLHQLFLLHTHRLVFRRDFRPWSKQPIYVSNLYWLRYFAPRKSASEKYDPDYVPNSHAQGEEQHEVEQKEFNHKPTDKSTDGQSSQSTDGTSQSTDGEQSAPNHWSDGNNPSTDGTDMSSDDHVQESTDEHKPMDQSKHQKSSDKLDESTDSHTSAREASAKSFDRILSTETTADESIHEPRAKLTIVPPGYQGSHGGNTGQNSGHQKIGSLSHDPTSVDQSDCEDDGTRLGEQAIGSTRFSTRKGNLIGENDRKLREMLEAEQDLELEEEVFCFLSRELDEDISEPGDYKEALMDQRWIQSMQSEIQKLTDKGTFELVDRPSDRKVVKSVWAFKLKRDFEGKVKEFKSRLNAAGYAQVPGQDYTKTYAAVGKKFSLRLVLRLIAAYNLKFALLDFESAFLNGIIDVELFMEQPRGMTDGSNRVWKLNKSIYGLKQSAAIWKATLSSLLLKLKFVPCTMDDCIFFGTDLDLPRLLFIHVDDLLAAAINVSHLLKLKELLQLEYAVKMEIDPKLVLGIEVRSEENKGIHLSQSQYLLRLVKKYRRGSRTSKPLLEAPVGFTFDKIHGPDIESKTEEVDQVWFHAAVGAILHAAVNTRPDLSYYVSFLGKYVSKPTKALGEMLESLIDYIEDTYDHGIFYDFQPVLEPLDHLITFTDSDFATDPSNRKSRSGIAICLMGGLIAWNSKQQPIVALGTSAAELISSVAGIRISLEVRVVLYEVCRQVVVIQESDLPKIQLRVDNTASIVHLQAEEFLSGANKHLAVRFFWVKEIKDGGHLQVQYVQSEDNLADMFTKSLSGQVLKKARHLIGLVPPFLS
jgi:Reverse transcriptase (RNA-dependent DNA polymerase)